MIIYLETSSLVKLYVEEDGSSEIAKLVSSADAVATSLIAYAEARAAFARRFREGSFPDRHVRALISSLHQDWERLLIITVTDELVRFSGDLAERHHLRGFDAIHLSSALTLKRETAYPVIFSTADLTLQRASQKENLTQP